MQLRTKALFDSDTYRWYVEHDGERIELSDQDCFGHSRLQPKRDENQWITVTITPKLWKDQGFEGYEACFVCFGPLFQHDCEKCEFWGVFYGHDVWYCQDSDGGVLGGSLIARHGDDGPDYGSTPLSVLLRQLNDPYHMIGDHQNNVTMPYRDWVWKHGQNYAKAWIMALAVHQIKYLIPNLEG